MGKGIDSDENGGHKRTRFPCLATARYVVAAVVSVLTVAVVVMVIIVALRPGKVIFSIPHNCIVANSLWWHEVSSSVSNTEHAPTVQPPVVGGMAASAVNTNTAAGTVTAGRVIINDADDDVPLDVTYCPVKNVSFLLSFSAYNPSGRADVLGENVTIRVLDMPNYRSPNFSFETTTLTEIITYELQDPFSVNRQTTHTLREWIVVNNTDVLSYLAEMYGGWTSFMAMVQLSYLTSVTSTEPQIYYCWPVIIGTYSGSCYDWSRLCRPEKEMDSNVTYSGPPPAPVPAPAPAPAPTAAAR